MKKYLTLMGLIACGMSALHAYNPCPEPKVTCGSVCCDVCGILNPYQNNECGTTLVFGVGYVGGIFAPQNTVVAQSGVYDGSTTPLIAPAPGSFVDTKLKWANGVEITVGINGQGAEGVGLISDTLFVLKNNGVSTVSVPAASDTMKTTYPFKAPYDDFLGFNSEQRVAPIGNVFTASGQYINNGYLFSTAMITRPQVQSKCSLFLTELGLSVSSLNHSFIVTYTETVTDGPTQIVYATAENILSVGPHVRFRARQLLGNCFTLEGMLGVAGHVQSNSVVIEEAIIPSDTTSVALLGSFVNVISNLRRYTHLVEGKLGVNYHACYDSHGFCNGGKKKCCPELPEIPSFTSIEFGLSWNFHARPAFTMVTDVPFGVGAGTMQPWIAQYLVASIRVKL